MKRELEVKRLDHCNVMKGRKSQPLHHTLLKTTVAVGATRPLQLTHKIGVKSHQKNSTRSIQKIL